METEILSEDELADLTGYKHRGHQRQWLKDRYWVFIESRGGRPLVGRMFTRMKLGILSPSLAPKHFLQQLLPGHLISLEELICAPNTENRDLPPGMVRRKRPRKNGTVWIGYYYRDANGKEIALGGDLDKARLKWGRTRMQSKAGRSKNHEADFDSNERDIVPKKAPRTQKDNKAEFKICAKGSIPHPLMQ